MKAADFQRQNQIHFQASIVRGPGWHWAGEDGQLGPATGQADVLDLNGNQAADTAWFGPNVGYAEPVLQVGLDRLRARAERKGTEVITQGDVSDLNLVDLSVRERQASTANPRSIRTLVAEHAPFEPGAEWAILLGPTPSFVIYTPG